jgi:hypothetical protein
LATTNFFIGFCGLIRKDWQLLTSFTIDFNGCNLISHCVGIFNKYNVLDGLTILIVEASIMSLRREASADELEVCEELSNLGCATKYKVNLSFVL